MSHGRRRPLPHVGVMEWFVKGERQRVERVARSLSDLGVRHIRTGLSWAEWHSEGGRDWYDWLLPRLAREFEVLPCVAYTPPSLGIHPHVTAPPRRTRDYADFLDVVVDRYGGCFHEIELWNEPNNLSDWDWRVDTDWSLFASMVADGANWMRHRGKRTVLAGMSPADPQWLQVMGEHGVLHLFDVVGVHGFPETWEPHWRGWNTIVDEVRAVLDVYAPDADIWITEVGGSTWRGDEHSQLRELAAALDAPVGRVYVYCAEDLAPDRPTNDGVGADVRDYHFGLSRADGTPKLLWRVWHERGLNGVRQVARAARAPALSGAP